MSLDQTIQHYRSELMHYEQQAEHAIRSAHSRMLSTVVPHLDPVYKQLRDAQSGDQKVPLHWLYTNNRLPTIKHLVKDQVNQFGATAKSQVLIAQRTGAGLGQQSAHAQMNTVAPHHTIKTPSPAATGKITGYTQQGKPIDDLMDGYGDEASDRVGKALIVGVSIGQKPDTLSRAIMAALTICLSRALVVARTSEMEAYRSSVLITFQTNDEIANMWEWIAQPGACKFCQAMDGTRHDISEEMISHPNCRCVQKIVVA